MSQPRLTALCLTLLTLAAGGCATQRGQAEKGGYDWPYPENEPPPSTAGLGSDEGAEPPQSIAALPSMEPLPDFPRSAEQVSGTAVMALIRQARQARAAGKPDQAQAKLERALKIEPRNYFAWSALAATYLDQKNYEQAASVAGKSNSLARGNIYVELENYRVIQEARLALGQSDASFAAKARAEEIQQRLERAAQP